MKYYIYISKTKVDMLFGQIKDQAEMKSIREVKFDFKIFSGSRKQELGKIDSIFARVSIISDYIKNNLNVSNIKMPDDYIYDTLPMQWGILTPHYAILDEDKTFNDIKQDDEFYRDFSNWAIVMFCGHRDNVYVALSGSVHHIIGVQEPVMRNSKPGDDMLASWNGFFKFVEENAKFYGNKHYILRGDELLGGFHALRNTFSATPEQKIEFLAKTLLVTDIGEKTLIVGSPIYTALASYTDS